LYMGSDFAGSQGDSARAQTYGDTAKAVEATLMNHYQDGYVYETQDSGRKKDAAVIAAFNDGYLADKPMFEPTGQEVAGTISTLNSLFCSAYTINGQDTAAGVPGILYGRYEGDNYDGGNPWILLTAALAQQLYRGAGGMATEAVSMAQQRVSLAQQQQAQELDVNANNNRLNSTDTESKSSSTRTQSSSSSSVMTEETMAVWRQILGSDPLADVDGSDGVARAEAMAQAMSGAGDGVLMRIRKYVEGDDFHMQEQIDRTTGAQTSAHDLTWSYATVLKAMHERASTVSTLSALADLK